MVSWWSAVAALATAALGLLLGMEQGARDRERQLQQLAIDRHTAELKELREEMQKLEQLAIDKHTAELKELREQMQKLEQQVQALFETQQKHLAFIDAA